MCQKEIVPEHSGLERPLGLKEWGPASIATLACRGRGFWGIVEAQTIDGKLHGTAEEPSKALDELPFGQGEKGDAKEEKIEGGDSGSSPIGEETHQENEGGLKG